MAQSATVSGPYEDTASSGLSRDQSWHIRDSESDVEQANELQIFEDGLIHEKFHAVTRQASQALTCKARGSRTHTSCASLVHSSPIMCLSRYSLCSSPGACPNCVPFARVKTMFKDQGLEHGKDENLIIP